MNRKKRWYVFLMVSIILICTGCGTLNDQNKSEEGESKGFNKEPHHGSSIPYKGDNIMQEEHPSKQEEPDPIYKKVQDMTLDEKIGQMFIVGLEGHNVDVHTKNMINQYYIGGFILYKKNVKDIEQLVQLLNSLKVANSVNKVPLFLSVDEEGGKVTRMPEGFSSLPSNRKVGKLNDEKLSFDIGIILGQQLKAFGYNMNFAPVLDIDSNPKNPVIGDRSFGSDAEIVSKLGIQTMRGIQSQGVISVVKHFPGHGDTSVDSHKGLPVVEHDLERLKNFELVPFKNVIENGGDAVMVAHILNPILDAEKPSSMSSVIITDLLRNTMNFNGIIMTDDMTMGAIIKHYDIGDAVVESVIAGSDIVLVCHEYEKQLSALQAIKQAVLNGKILESRVNESVYRILRMKEKYALDSEIVNSVNYDKINNEINKIQQSWK